MTSTTSRAVAVATVAVLGFTVASCGSDSPSSSEGDAGSATGGATAIALALTEAGCDPTTIAAAAGDVVFSVKNEREDKAEFEILTKEPKILAEEFLEPGASGTFTENLAAGDYEIICGAPSDTRAALTVTGEGGATAQLKVDPAELDAAVAAYTAYVNGQVDDLINGTDQLVAAVKSGDVAEAKALYAPVRLPWERIEPIAELFPDSDAVIDSRVDDFSGPEDPEFTGFHRLEKGLFEDGSTQGLDSFADRLQTDVDDLAAKVKALKIAPDVMVNGAAGLIEEAAQTKITGEEERYSKTDLVTFAANVDGAREIHDQIDALLRSVDPALNGEITQSFSRIDQILQPYQQGDGYVSYDQLDDSARNQLKAALAGLSENLALVAGAFGLEVS
jgi:iron uptake system component EfeO